jgi:predicted ArsR family transcriptional regulator
MSAPKKSVRLSDPIALRAYAHPLRMSLVGLLRREGPLTATQAAERLGESVPNCSFHLRQLAKYGLAERVEGSDARERPWRATALFTTWENYSADPEVQAAAHHLSTVVFERHVERAREGLARQQSEPPQWRNVIGSSDYVLYVTPEELQALIDKTEELFAGYLPRLTDPALRPPDARAIQVLQVSTPLDRKDA